MGFLFSVEDPLFTRLYYGPSYTRPSILPAGALGLWHVHPPYNILFKIPSDPPKSPIPGPIRLIPDPPSGSRTISALTHLTRINVGPAGPFLLELTLAFHEFLS